MIDTMFKYAIIFYAMIGITVSFGFLWACIEVIYEAYMEGKDYEKQQLINETKTEKERKDDC